MTDQCEFGGNHPVEKCGCDPHDGAQRFSSDHEFLEQRGWKYMTRRKQAYGWIHYWEHFDHQREDGRWWTQTQAAAYQRRLNKGPK